MVQEFRIILNRSSILATKWLCCMSASLVRLDPSGINAARTFGAGKRHIIFTHIIPDLSPIISALMMQDARRAVFMEAGLAFLGVSDPTVISWGKMMNQALAFTYLDVWQWWLVPTGLALSATLVAISFLSFSLETAVDPRLRKEKMVREGGNDALN